MNVIYSPFVIKWHGKYSFWSQIFVKYDGDILSKFQMCEELINIILMYDTTHAKLIYAVQIE